MLKKSLLPYLEKLRLRELTNREVADALHVHPSYLSRMLKELGVVKVPGERKLQRQLNEARSEYRSLVAKTLPTRKAAEAAHCSERTIYRWKKK